MGRQFVTAGQGLLKVFFGQALSIASAALSGAALVLQVPALLYLSVVVSLAGFVLVLIGLSGASIAHMGYRAAFGCVVANAAVSLLADISWLAAFHGLLSLLDLALGLCTAYLVCKTTADLLVEKGDDRRARRAAMVWKTYALCTALSAAAQIAAGLFYGDIWAAVLAGGALALILSVQCLYLWFLFTGQRALQRA